MERETYVPVNALSEKEISDIRKFYLTGIPCQLRLSTIYQVSPHVIEAIVKDLVKEAVHNRQVRFNWLHDDADIVEARNILTEHFAEKYSYGVYSEEYYDRVWPYLHGDHKTRKR